MRTLFRKPVIYAFFCAIVLTTSPFNIPPVPHAQGAETVVEIKPIPIMSEREFKIERTPESAKAYAKTQLAEWGWVSQWDCLEELWTRESNWRPDAYNKTPVFQDGERLHAGGIPQILGLDQSLTVEKQIERGFIYIEHRFSTPCKAMSYWNKHFSY
jgi:hypothetical protein